jgi:hypothetical protein
VPVILHATMSRAGGDAENMSMETASTLQKAGILVALQSGYETYVPKTRVRAVRKRALAAAKEVLTFESSAGHSDDTTRRKSLGRQARTGRLEAAKMRPCVFDRRGSFEYVTQT